MPELPEVEAVRRGLGRRPDRPHHRRRRRCCTRARSADTCRARRLRRPARRPDLRRARRRGKYLWLPFVDGDAVLAHLGMSGQFRLSAADAPQGATPGCWSTSPTAVRSSVSSTSGCSAGCSLSRGRAPSCPPEIAHIARDPFDPAFDLDDVVARLRRKRTGVKRALLDQQLVSRGRQHLRRRGAVARPGCTTRAPTDTMSRPEAAEVLDRGRDGDGARRSGRAARRSTPVRQRERTSGYFDRSLAAYGQEGEPCPRCGTPIRREAVHEPLVLPLPALPADPERRPRPLLMANITRRDPSHRRARGLG